jgi:hypothetical protein
LEASVVQTPASSRQLTWYGLGVVAIVALFAGWTWDVSGSCRAIRRLPSTQRIDLFQRTEANLRSVCLPSQPSGLDEFCTAQARLLLEFPECGEACEALARSVLPKATR